MSERGHRTRMRIWLLSCVAVSLAACGTPEEAERVRLPVVLDTSGVETVTTDQGYVVTLTEARVVVENFAFAIAGEAHTASILDRIRERIVPTAYAHPGHYQGGDVTGELRGRFLLDWLADANSVATGKSLYDAHCAECHGEFASGGSIPGGSIPGGTAPSIAGHPSIGATVREGKGKMPAVDLDPSEVDAIQAYLAQRLGQATLLVGDYHSANFTFSTATTEDQLSDPDVLLQHTAVLRGQATKNDAAVNFVALLTSPAGRQLVGAPFVSTVKRDTHESLGVRFNTKDPLESDTLFDGIDFAALDYDGDGNLTLSEEGSEEPLSPDAGSKVPDTGTLDAGDAAALHAKDANDAAVAVDAKQQLEAAYDRLKRTFQTHDHFDIKPKPLSNK